MLSFKERRGTPRPGRGSDVPRSGDKQRRTTSPKKQKPCDKATGLSQLRKRNASRKPPPGSCNPGTMLSDTKVANLEPLTRRLATLKTQLLAQRDRVTDPTPGRLTIATPDRETRSGLHVDCMSSCHEGWVGTRTYGKAVEVLHGELTDSRSTCVSKPPSSRNAGESRCVSHSFFEPAPLEQIAMADILVLRTPPMIPTIQSIRLQTRSFAQDGGRTVMATREAEALV